MGQFLHPAIVNGLNFVYFHTEKAWGYKQPMAGKPALTETLSAEAVAWICIGVSDDVIFTDIDILGSSTCLSRNL
jgi:hypothetical protein